MRSDSDEEVEKELSSRESSERETKISDERRNEIYCYFLEFELSQDNLIEQKPKNHSSNSNDHEDIKRTEKTCDNGKNNNESDIYYDFDSESELEDLQNVGWGTDEETSEIISPSQRIFEMIE